MSSILKAPWQVGLAVGATLLVAADYLGQALTNLALLAGSSGIEPVLEYDAISGASWSYDISARVLFAVGAGLLILGAFLWAGAFRAGVRAIITVALVVSFVRHIVSFALAFDPANGVDIPGFVEAEFNNVIALVAVSLLWFGAGRRWVAHQSTEK